METECWVPCAGETQSEQGTVCDKAQKSVSNCLQKCKKQEHLPQI